METITVDLRDANRRILELETQRNTLLERVRHLCLTINALDKKCGGNGRKVRAEDFMELK